MSEGRVPGWRGWYKGDRLTQDDLEREAGVSYIQHGAPGHTGMRCRECAYQSKAVIPLYPAHDDDGWQDRLIKWQENCDTLMHDFDIRVAEHFPVHQPAGCTTCPTKPSLPIKPVVPYERI